MSALSDFDGLLALAAADPQDAVAFAAERARLLGSGPLDLRIAAARLSNTAAGLARVAAFLEELGRANAVAPEAFTTKAKGLAIVARGLAPAVDALAVEARQLAAADAAKPFTANTVRADGAPEEEGCA